MPFRASRTPFFGFWGAGWTENSRPALPICAGSISGESGLFMPERASFPIFLRATMPQVQSPDTGEGSGCGRFRVYLATSAWCRRAKLTCKSAAKPCPLMGAGGDQVELWSRRTATYGMRLRFTARRHRYLSP